MATALAVFHGRFGRASLYRLNKPLAPHAHREGHLIFKVAGAGADVIVEGKVYGCGDEQAVAVSPWQPHEFRPTDFGKGSIFLTLYISPRWFLEMSSNLEMMRFGSSQIILDGQLKRLLTRVAAMLADGHVGERFAGELYELTGTAFDISWSGPRVPGSFPRHRVSDFRIRNALKLMNERVSDECVLNRIARDAGLSRPHFYKLFRQNVGLTPNIYLNTLRLERSIERLTRTDDPVTAIGLDLGFASQASFTRFFSNNIGIAPTDYRRVSIHAA